MFGQLLTIAKNTFKESVRQPIYFVLVMLCGVLILLSTWGTGFSMGYTESGEVSSDNKLLLDIGLATVFVCGMLLAAFIATAVISREIENRTVLTVVSKPVKRPVVVLGKYLGVAAAMLIAVVTMLMFLQMAIRHGVLSTASDELDGPVLLFTFLAVFIAFAVGIWCNFFYGWVFTQTATLLLCPLMLVAWVCVLVVSPKWQIQPIATSFKLQITMASIAVVLAQLVLAAIATAASSRLGQVMTIVVCAGVFMLGLLSNHLFGRLAYRNEWVGRIDQVFPTKARDEGLTEPGMSYMVALQNEPKQTIKPGDCFFYSPSPNGIPMLTRSFPPFKGDVAERSELLSPTVPPSLIVTEVKGKQVTVMRAGGAGPLFQGEGGASGLFITPRPPARLDYVFLRETQVNVPALVVWGLVPNVQFFWLLDAVTQNQPIPWSHIGLVALYAAAQIGVFLSVAVIFFQRREVG
ncbi:MAG: ABC transporter permease subunit [Phycisphaeraceae bacterium]|nr:ABC transporter permease subunit [Phycisphaeraceae bacterium]